ncbi:MAG TPA: sugar phosphate isomerase/epimerase [Patescibacteria group bacterium]|nr:sugar phosphate isomerase/epimerase [Patescibacteria group bacterium]
MVRIANAPCSWGVIEGIDGERAGYVRVIDEMQETGYIGTELGDWGFMPTDPDELRVVLDARGLALIGSWVSVNLEDRARHRANADDAVRTGKQLARVGGAEAVVVLGNDPYGNLHRTTIAGRVRVEDGMTGEEWAAFAEGANYVARRVMDEAGIRTVVHQHIGTLIETEAEARRLVDMTDPTVLGLCLDTGHWMFGTGGDPVVAVREFRDRVWHVHFKDCDPAVMEASRANEWSGPQSVGHGVFCELGKGCVDFPGMLAALDEIGYRGWIVVEQDVLPGMGNPRESARRNREYLRLIGA